MNRITADSVIERCLELSSDLRVTELFEKKETGKELKRLFDSLSSLMIRVPLSQREQKIKSEMERLQPLIGHNQKAAAQFEALKIHQQALKTEMQMKALTIAMEEIISTLREINRIECDDLSNQIEMAKRQNAVLLDLEKNKIRNDLSAKFNVNARSIKESSEEGKTVFTVFI